MRHSLPTSPYRYDANQPQCGIFGVGAIQKRVVVVTDEFGYDTIAIRPMVYLTLTFDHRILDGAGADHFLAKVVESLENWRIQGKGSQPRNKRRQEK